MVKPAPATRALFRKVLLEDEFELMLIGYRLLLTYVDFEFIKVRKFLKLIFNKQNTY